MARQVLPVVGAIVGAYFGNPQLGWAIGSAIGNAVDPQVLPGPKIGEIPSQTSQEGGPRPIVFALSQPMPGNIIFAGEPRIVRRKESQGKGGPKVETESVYRTYAMGVCEGPITSFYRVWRNGILVYDVSDEPLLSTAENAKFLESARFFLGTYDQAASPDIEALTSPAPTHRGTAYMVQADEDLTDVRGMIPQYVFQVERCEGIFRTSRPYPVEYGDAMASAGEMTFAELATPPGPTIKTTTMAPEGFDSTGDGRRGVLRDPLQTYEVPPEGFDSAGEAAEATLRVAIVVYEWPAEGFDTAGEIADAELKQILIVYDDADPEGFDSTGEAVEGSLHEP